MTCGKPLGATTFIVVGSPGGKPAVVMTFCGGACMSDMQIMGWIQQTHDDMVQQIHFRGGAVAADEPEA